MCVSVISIIIKFYDFLTITFCSFTTLTDWVGKQTTLRIHKTRQTLRNKPRFSVVHHKQSRFFLSQQGTTIFCEAIYRKSSYTFGGGCFLLRENTGKCYIHSRGSELLAVGLVGRCWSCWAYPIDCRSDASLHSLSCREYLPILCTMHGSRVATTALKKTVQ